MPARTSDLREDRWNQAQIDSLSELMYADRTEEILLWADENFAPKWKFACSFDLEDIVLLHLTQQLGLKPHVFFLDTGRLHQQTYDLIDEYRQRYDIELEIYLPEQQRLGELLKRDGFNHFYQDPKARRECCKIRRAEPLARALVDADAWLTGLRAEQSVNRASAGVLELDTVHGGILKINPLFAWTDEHIWTYIQRHNLPYNALHDEGYSSIGCAPCTRAVKPGEDHRAGRWWWEKSDKECELNKSEQSHLKIGKRPGRKRPFS